MSVYEIIRDSNGEPLASVCLREPITDEERETLVEYFTWKRDHPTTNTDSAFPGGPAPVERGPAHDPPPGLS